MCYIHKGQNKFTTKVRKLCKYYLDGVGINFHYKRRVRLRVPSVCFLNTCNASSLGSTSVRRKPANLQGGHGAYIIRYSLCTCDFICISGIHANVVQQYIILYYIILYYIILYYIILSLIRIFMREPKHAAEFQQDGYARNF